MGRDVPNFWWVNQNKTYRQETKGGYLWSPKRKRDGARNPFYDHMRLVVPGDIILSFAETRIPAVGIAISHCYEAPKPTEFGKAGDDWSAIGWRVDVTYQVLTNSLRPADHMQALAPLLPKQYSPLQPDGRGLQSVYLTPLPQPLMYQLALLIGAPVLQLLESTPFIARDPLREDNPVQERWERQIIADLRQLSTVTETEREQLIDARVGQGRFRALVYDREKACRVTRVDRPEHLIASHIRPWRHSENDQRLDPENGLMLTPNIDHLFDRGFITFESGGRLVVSPTADRVSLIRLGVDPDARIDAGNFSSGQKRHLEYHRDEIFLGVREAG
jgi:putative restriction endonuclease